MVSNIAVALVGLSLFLSGMKMVSSSMKQMASRQMRQMFAQWAGNPVGGFIGGNIDSLIGDLLENRKYIGNAGTNLLATLGGGVVAGIIWVIITPLF